MDLDGVPNLRGDRSPPPRKEGGCMSALMKPCIVCGEISDRTYCEDHRPKDSRPRPYRSAGYDSRWERLSLRARKLQPWCSNCGSTDDLTCDHSEEAWKRKEAGLPIRIVDVDVLCRSCNSKKGAARTRGVDPHPTAGRPHAGGDLSVTHPGGYR